MAELKPCPFCGSKDVSNSWYYDEAYEGKIFHVRCHKCAALGPIEATEQQAIDAWNRRVRV